MSDASFLSGTVKKITANAIPLLASILAAASVLGFLFYFYAPPQANIGPEQPIPFSHRVHAGVKNIQCQFCHPYVSRSEFPGIPPVEKCLYCHKYIIANLPWIQKEHRLFNTDSPTPWAKVNYIPEHVFFKHERHIKKDIACQECHGAVEKMDRVKRDPFQMGFCVGCHREKKVNLGCWLACHN